MRLIKPRFIGLGLGALAALPLLWSVSADAANVNCLLGHIGGGGLIVGPSRKYSVECSGNGLDVVGEALCGGSHTVLQVRLRIATNTTTQVAIAQGYDAAQQALSGCIITDSTPGLNWESQSCVNLLQYLTVSAHGSS